MKIIIKYLFIIVLLVTLNRCTVQYSMGGANIEPDVETISIKDFPNRAPRGPADFENYFTNELKDKFQSQTSLTLVGRNGDLDLTGEITDYNTKPVAVGGDETASETRLTVTVHVVFINAKHPDDNFDTSFSQYEDFDASQNLSSVEDELIKNITEKIVQDIFNKAVVNW